MSIQSGLNTMLTTLMGGVLGAKHIKNQQVELQDKQALEMGKIENAMTESALTGEIIDGKEVKPEEAKEFNIANTLGLKVSPEYQSRYDKLQMIKSSRVLQSETYAKLQQDTLLRKRFSDLISTQEGRTLLNQTLTKRDDKDNKDGGKK